ncbi:pantetheine-phosphate adenylyltransferase [Geotalea daltonii FRC-32]|uniref:Phosphopantetheine adenylyltransferase n=1 Tax=Geotalea daltonii (strain DSM 22248 / JCM 15807 / FRC-32) TaxID=316067 RepID=COAD_GEODF|nr:pantetheine-phosphate adenylyltransferase [Geotalea daltonii]B9M4U3.1 RecName: Full=Phosphopantetheine adenylyltransferase; AltName: Full=Dephospho-CoA pyrophosphorylase; AltName: Full=Pantetheine-phosphate adenylyltransferase; Short=PPAT [Geotalea daltonii FRC-32]ACM21627.1 pantetheine-phosphate adenylyltransferase [Geotalea daltonii FRC-32]
MPLKIAVYPGSFDPITYGHLDIIERGLRIFDKIIVAVAKNSEKNSLFPTDERIALIKEVLGDSERAEVDTFTGLLVDYVRDQGATVIIRGLRAVSDFEYEFQLAQMNRSITQDIETLFMMTSVPYSYLSSSIVKEVSSLNGPIEGLVPPAVKKALDAKFNR